MSFRKGNIPTSSKPDLIRLLYKLSVTAPYPEPGAGFEKDRASVIFATAVLYLLDWYGVTQEHKIEKIINVGSGDAQEQPALYAQLKLRFPENNIIFYDIEPGLTSNILDIASNGMMPSESVVIIRDSGENQGVFEGIRTQPEEKFPLVLIRNPNIHSFNSSWNKTIDNVVAYLAKGGLIIFTCESGIEEEILESILSQLKDLEIAKFCVLSTTGTTHVTRNEDVWIVAIKK